MNIPFLQAHSTNYLKGRTQVFKYLVFHYTANNGDTAKNNADYYSRTANLLTSAHYFVDENGFYQSVKDADTAWHCGAKTYVHPEARNANSIGIEMCSRVDNAGKYFIKPEVQGNAILLAQVLMAQYKIDPAHCIRHYDVTGKVCPRPFVETPALWDGFKAMLASAPVTARNADAPSTWAVEGTTWAIRNGIVTGSGGVYGWHDTPTKEQIAVMLYRALKLPKA
jgi:N-acetylmuramoyl-L-alanine amidase